MFRPNAGAIKCHNALTLDIAYLAALSLALISVLSTYVVEVIATQSPSFEFLASALNHVGSLTIVQYALLSLAMLVVLYLHRNKAQNRFDYRLLLLSGIALRLMLIPIDSYTSSDISRYLFDGKLAYEGFDPYRISHDHASIQALREIWQPPAEHAKYVTLYPPLALALFSFAASFGYGKAFIVWKLFTTAASIATLLVSYFFLKRANKLSGLALVALSPLLIFEAGIGGHIDSFSCLFVALTILAWQANKPIFTGLFIALGTLSKLLPLALALPLFFFSKSLNAKLKLSLGVITTLLVAYSFAFYIGLHPIGSIGVFFQKWRFGSPLFQLIESLTSNHYFYIIAALMLGATLFIAIKSYKTNSDSKKTLYLQSIIALPLLLSPVVFPWYLMPLIPLLALSPQPWLLLWVILVPLSYEVLNAFISQHIWQPQTWPLTLIALGLLIGLLIANKNNFSRMFNQIKIINARFMREA